MKAKKAKKRMTVMANCPVPKDISKESSSRSQFSIKDKRKVAKYAVKHNMTAREVTVGTQGRVSMAQAGAWKRDFIGGKFNLSNSVSISRSGIQ